MITLTQIETFYDKAKTKINERYYIDKNGLRQGISKLFCENGQLEKRYTYKDGQVITKSEILIQN